MLISIGTLDLNYDHEGVVKVYQKEKENLIFEGQMKSGILDGQGTIFENNNMKYIGQFSKNYLHGEITEFQNNGNKQKKFFSRDREVSQEIYKQQISQVQQLYYSFYLDYNINIFAYNALEPGKMLFENTVDYLIEYFRNYYESFRGKLITQLFNTSQTSDHISNDSNDQFVISQELDQSKNSDRYVFVLNSQRSHFMIMIGDKGKLYQCDSLFMENKNRETEFSKLLKFKSNKCIKLNCSQQMNGYDCGIFAIYYALQFMKYDKLPIEQIERKLQTKNIAQFRWQLKQLIKNNHNYILTNI